LNQTAEAWRWAILLVPPVRESLIKAIKGLPRCPRVAAPLSAFVRTAAGAQCRYSRINRVMSVLASLIHVELSSGARGKGAGKAGTTLAPAPGTLLFWSLCWYIVNDAAFDGRGAGETAWVRHR
jgi:hypothetical protein